MHMADALISPTVGGVMWAASAGLAAYSARKLKEEANDRKVPLMGVLGAFVFAAQMINFTIPATGSSGHLSGGMILSILLGPYAAFLTMFSVLTAQALFFADGGLLALGCNVFNVGFWTCFVAYPLIFRKIAGTRPSQARLALGATLAGIVGLQLGAFSVIMETLGSGVSELPFGTFVLLMLPIHLAIGIVEGLVTTALVTFVWKARPEIVEISATSEQTSKGSLRTVLVGLLVATVFTGGALCWFASKHPDGLEWSISMMMGKEELEASGDGVHNSFAEIQKKTVILPDYDFRKIEEARESGKTEASVSANAEPAGAENKAAEPWPEVTAGKSLSGLVGGAMVLLLAGIVGLVLSRTRPQQSA